MRRATARTSVLLPLLPLLATLAASEPDPAAMEAFRQALQAEVGLFEPVALAGEGPTTFSTTLGDRVLRNPADPQRVFDGLRITLPADAVGGDLVWYVDAPAAWSHWYIAPAAGDLRPAFGSWTPPWRVYLDVGDPVATGRFRFLQTLRGDWFDGGGTFILWFSTTVAADAEPAVATVHGRLGFVAAPEEWTPEAMEAALELEPAPPATQIAALDSRGGRALLEAGWFDPAYAASRIESMLAARRDLIRMQGGFFIKMETVTPPCTRAPELPAIVERHGAADFVRSTAERARAWSGDEDGGDPLVQVHHYDRFGFEVRSDDPRQRVRRVHVFPVDYRVLAPPPADAAPGFARLGSDNLTVFHRDGRECGRIYYFLEAGKQPVVVTAPPPGVYRAAEVRLEHLGQGAWIQEDLRTDGSVARRLPLADHRYHGEGEWCHPDGSVAMRLPFRHGVAHGEALRYDPAGTVIERRRYHEGERVE